jgi:hypothetical protein
MDTPPENPTPPPQSDSTPPSTGPSSFANNPYAKQYMNNPYGQMSSKHPADLPIGIIIIVFSGLAVLGSLALIGLGGATTVAGGGTAVSAVGGGVAIIGMILLAVSVINIIGAVGILKGARWGFMITGIMSAISVILDIVHLQIVGLIIAGACAAYCFMRLTGQLGGKPS